MKYFGETGKCGFLKCSLANYVARGAARCGQYWRSGWKVQCWKQPCCQQCWTVFWEIIVRSLERRWNGWLAGLVGEWRGHIVLLVMGARGCLETNGSFYESSGLTSTLYPGKCPEEEGLLPSGGRREPFTKQPLQSWLYCKDGRTSGKYGHVHGEPSPCVQSKVLSPSHRLRSCCILFICCQEDEEDFKGKIQISFVKVLALAVHFTRWATKKSLGNSRRISQNLWSGESWRDWRTLLRCHLLHFLFFTISKGCPGLVRGKRMAHLAWVQVCLQSPDTHHKVWTLT